MGLGNAQGFSPAGHTTLQAKCSVIHFLDKVLPPAMGRECHFGGGS